MVDKGKQRLSHVKLLYSRSIEIPNDWNVVRVKDVCKIVNGSGFPLEHQKVTTDEIPFIKVSDMNLPCNDIYIRKTNNTVSRKVLQLLKANLCPEQTLIFPKIGATISTNKRRLLSKPSCFDNNIMGLIPIQIDRFFLYYLFLQIRLENFAQTTALPYIDNDIIGNMKIQICERKEQERISAILSKVDELIQRTDQVIEQTQRLKKGLMQRLLTKGIGHTEFKRTELGDIPKTWSLTILNSVCDKIQDGSHFSPKIQYPAPGKNRFLYITAKNIKENGVDLSDVAYVDKQFHVSIYSRCNPEKGDVLLIKDGVMTGVAIVNNLDEPFSMLSSVALIKTSKSVLDAHYLKHYLESPLGFIMITNQMTGTAIKRIVLDKIRTSPIPLPPIFEQKKIGHIISSMDKKISVLSNYKTTTEHLKKGLMQKLLTGKIRVKV